MGLCWYKDSRREKRGAGSGLTSWVADENGPGVQGGLGYGTGLDSSATNKKAELKGTRAARRAAGGRDRAGPLPWL